MTMINSKFKNFISDCKFAIKDIRHARWWDEATGDTWEEGSSLIIDQWCNYFKNTYGIERSRMYNLLNGR